MSSEAYTCGVSVVYLFRVLPRQGIQSNRHAHRADGGWVGHGRADQAIIGQINQLPDKGVVVGANDGDKGYIGRLELLDNSIIRARCPDAIDLLGR